MSEEPEQLDVPSSANRVTIGGVEVTTAEKRKYHLRMLLWGRYGAGKTTLAATAPAPILYLGFDHDGDAPLRKSSDLLILDYSNAAASVVFGFRGTVGTSMQELDRYLTKRAEEGAPISTLIIDSMTSFGRMALEHGVVGAKTTIEDPEFKGYGRKNTWVNYAILGLLRIAGRHDLHLIVVCHEDKPNRDKEGNVIEYPIMLGSSLAYQIPVSINEVWYLEQTTTGHAIRVRPSAQYKHVKTRLFSAQVRAFPWVYNPETGEGLTLAKIYQVWQANDFGKISV